jgi:hypothetical protein
VRHAQPPGCAHISATIEGTVHVYRLEYIGKHIFLKMSERFHRISSLIWTIGKELWLFRHGKS